MFPAARCRPCTLDITYIQPYFCTVHYLIHTLHLYILLDASMEHNNPSVPREQTSLSTLTSTGQGHHRSVKLEVLARLELPSLTLPKRLFST